MKRTDPEYQKNRKYAALGVFLFSIGLLAILLLAGLTFEEPPPEEMGVEVNLGNSDLGMGTIQPRIPAEVPQSTPPTTQAQENFATQSTEEAPVAAPQQQTQPQQTQPEPQPDPTPTLDPRLTYTGSQSSGGNEGTTGNPGDQGQQGGNPNSGNYTGSPGPGGGGPSVVLSGRSSKRLPAPSKNFSQSGIVVVKIWVNRDGKVTRALAGAPGTTTSSATLRKLAEQAAYKAEFNADPRAAVEQVGTITYRFTTN